MAETVDGSLPFHPRLPTGNLVASEDFPALEVGV